MRLLDFSTYDINLITFTVKNYLSIMNTIEPMLNLLYIFVKPFLRI